MSHHLSTTGTFASAMQVFVLLLLALFATEIAAAGLVASLPSQLHPLVSGLFAALVVCAFLAWPLWFFVTRTLLEVKSTELGAVTVLPLWIKVMLVIFLAESAALLLQTVLPTDYSTLLRDLRAAALATLFAAPFLWRLLFRREIRRCRVSMTDLLGTPFGLYVLLLHMVLIADLLLGWMVPLLFPGPSLFSRHAVDSAFTTLLLAPLLWLFVARPLRRAILTEHARVRAVHAQITDAVVSIDAHGVIESFNPAAERIFGYTADEVSGQSANLLLATEQNDLEALIAKVANREDRAGPSPVYVVSGRRHDGVAITMEVSLSRVLQEGAAEYLLIMRDISVRKAMEKALRESKERFRQIFEQSEDAIIFLRPEALTMVDVNATAEKIFGRSRHEFLASGLTELLPRAEMARLSAALCRLVPGEIMEFDALTCRRPDGTSIKVSVRGRFMEIQKVHLLFITFRDVTERLRLEAESREIQSQLIHANKMTSLGLMVSGVAHEINNPNNCILAHATLLAQGWDDARKVLRDYARENGDFLIGGLPFAEFDAHAPQLTAGILDGSRRINAIVSELKGYARREREGELQETDINQVATTAVSIVNHELVRFTKNFHLQLGAELPPVRGSGQQLGQVIVNLLMNSCQSLSDPGCGIWLTTSHDVAAGEVVIVVRDEGCGMVPEVGRRSMEPFFTTRIDSGGTGLGLSICHSIVKKHAGTMTFTSASGAGTEFCVRLPVAALTWSANDRNQ